VRCGLGSIIIALGAIVLAKKMEERQPKGNPKSIFQEKSRFVIGATNFR
jgi:hypothetical protein